MKKLFLTLSLMAMTMTMMAVPAKRGLWSTVQLANGTEVQVQLVGDEHGHWLRDANGNCYVDNNGTYELMDEQTLTVKRQARVSDRRKAVYASTSDGLGKKGTMSRGSVPSIGEYTIPVVMVQFSDTKFKSTTTVEKMTRYYNEEGYHDESGAVGSVRDYFKAQSGGQFVPTFDVVGIVTLSNSYKTYGADQGDYTDYNLGALPGDVISAAISQLGVDFSKYVVAAGDSYHTAGVPLMAMLYAGKGQATESQSSANNNLIWPCEWDAEEDDKGGTYSGVHFNSFFVGNELLGSKLMGMAVFCHEFGHALGLPDFYVTDNSYGGDDPFGHWSIMDTGAYVDDDCRTPIGYNAYEKSYMGWLELKEIGSADAVTLQSPDGLAENSAYIIRNSNTETFIFENRQPGTWYPSAFGSGVLVSRIAYSYNAWNSNTLNNTQSKKRACVLTANGAKLNYSASSANLYGNAKTSIGSLKTYSGSTKDMGIKKVTKNSDGTITLTLNEGGSVEPEPEPQPTPDDALFYESFDQCNGTGGNDGQWSGGVASSIFVADNEGWTVTGDKAYGADKCAKFGTSTVKGEATTPAIALNGTTTMTFKAGAWNSKNDGTTLNLTATGGTVSPSSVTMTKGGFTDYTVTLTATGSVKVAFAADKGRFFLDEVLVKDLSTAISNIEAAGRQPGAIYTLDGRFVGTDYSVLSRGLYIINGCKVVK